MDKEKMISPLFERAYIFLETQNLKNATDYIEKVLDFQPNNAEAYLGKLLAKLKISNKDDLKNCRFRIDNQDNYILALKFANSDLRNFLILCSNNINNKLSENRQKNQKRIKNIAKITGILISAFAITIASTHISRYVITPRQEYKRADKLFEEEKYEEAYIVYSSLGNFRDAESKVKRCEMILDEKAWVTIGNLIYKVPRGLAHCVSVSQNRITLTQEISSVNEFLSLLEPVEGWAFCDGHKKFLLENITYARCYNNTEPEYLDLEFYIINQQAEVLSYKRKGGEHIQKKDFIIESEGRPSVVSRVSLSPSWTVRFDEKNTFSCNLYNESDKSKVVHFEFTVIINSK